MDFFKTPTKPPVVVTEDPSTGQPMVTVAKEEAPEAGAGSLGGGGGKVILAIDFIYFCLSLLSSSFKIFS